MGPTESAAHIQAGTVTVKRRRKNVYLVFSLYCLFSLFLPELPRISSAALFLSSLVLKESAVWMSALALLADCAPMEEHGRSLWRKGARTERERTTSTEERRDMFGLQVSAKEKCSMDFFYLIGSSRSLLRFSQADQVPAASSSTPSSSSTVTRHRYRCTTDSHAVCKFLNRRLSAHLHFSQQILRKPVTPCSHRTASA